MKKLKNFYLFILIFFIGNEEEGATSVVINHHLCVKETKNLKGVHLLIKTACGILASAFSALGPGPYDVN